MNFKHNDGGRLKAGFKSRGDCVTRAVALATGEPYTLVRLALSVGQMSQGRACGAGDGVYTSEPWFKVYMIERGFNWTSCDRLSDIPSVGTFVVSMHRHYTTIIDGIIHDTFDPQLDRRAASAVHGYWTRN